MENIDPITFIFYSLIFLGIVYEIRKHFFQKCEKCGGKFKMDSHKVSMGHNISKNVSFSYWRGPRMYTEIWKCQSCDHEQTIKYWDWDDD